jgi:hypothetical protein
MCTHHGVSPGDLIHPNLLWSGRDTTAPRNPRQRTLVLATSSTEPVDLRSETAPDGTEFVLSLDYDLDVDSGAHKSFTLKYITMKYSAVVHLRHSSCPEYTRCIKIDLSSGFDYTLRPQLVTTWGNRVVDDEALPQDLRATEALHAVEPFLRRHAHLIARVHLADQISRTRHTLHARQRWLHQAREQEAAADRTVSWLSVPSDWLVAGSSLRGQRDAELSELITQTQEHLNATRWLARALRQPIGHEQVCVLGDLLQNEQWTQPMVQDAFMAAAAATA